MVLVSSFRGLLRTGRRTQLSWGDATLLSSHAGRFYVSGGRHINRKPRPLGFGHLLSEPDPPDRGGDGDTHTLIAGRFARGCSLSRCVDSQNDLAWPRMAARQRER